MPVDVENLDWSAAYDLAKKLYWSMSPDERRLTLLFLVADVPRNVVTAHAAMRRAKNRNIARAVLTPDAPELPYFV